MVKAWGATDPAPGHGVGLILNLRFQADGVDPVGRARCIERVKQQGRIARQALCILRGGTPALLARMPVVAWLRGTLRACVVACQILTYHTLARAWNARVRATRKAGDVLQGVIVQSQDFDKVGVVARGIAPGHAVSARVHGHGCGLPNVVARYPR